MRKRISLLIAALMLALTMSLGGAGAAFADTQNLCEKHPEHKQCVEVNPGGVVDSPSCEDGRNPNCEEERRLPNQ